jgi:hypothetical protein
MGRQGDYSHREKKKQKKGSQKITPNYISTSPTEVEVIKKKRKPREEEEL